MYVNNTLDGSCANSRFESGDGYLTFASNSANLAVDNLIISTIPEPSAALLGGFGLLVLLRRRR